MRDAERSGEQEEADGGLFSGRKFWEVPVGGGG